ncbi:hypothetical protein SLH49_08920 [Cognatiyoonia sp. IB215446]|uniref:hypothetical protein n=1 Tax=Cognatiyoonia sp. IB215446 TaxID=3097355 RepID=UPI002A13EE92|nr:hypothetical protein [Cognatiyoonia sp. IB215446]MDX8348107.1 hypothetical protein [Cognatiyoonia sp. IB215446]
MHIVDINVSAAPFLAGAKWSFVTRRVRRSNIKLLNHDLAAAETGDLVLAEVQEIGSHKRLQLHDGRFSILFPKDRVVLACGDRFAEDQFEGIAVLSADGADLLAGGGVVGHMRTRNGRVGRPTRLSVIGRVADGEGRVINLADVALDKVQGPRPRRVIGVLGTGMNAGKTAAAAGLINGFARSGQMVAAIKATGTGSFGDVHHYEAAGAAKVLDFTDAGLASTYRQPLDCLEIATRTLLTAATDCDIAVVELADGVSQVETAQLLRRPGYRALFDAFVLAAPGALAARGALHWLSSEAQIAPIALSGLMTQAPLAVAEAEQLSLPVFSRETLADPATALCLNGLLACAEREGAA